MDSDTRIGLCIVGAVILFVVGGFAGQAVERHSWQTRVVEQGQIEVDNGSYRCQLIWVKGPDGRARSAVKKATDVEPVELGSGKTLREEIADMANRARELHTRTEELNAQRLQLTEDSDAFGVELDAFEERVVREVEK